MASLAVCIVAVRLWTTRCRRIALASIPSKLLEHRRRDIRKPDAAALEFLADQMTDRFHVEAHLHAINGIWA
jgi:hypothetical protein